MTVYRFLTTIIVLVFLGTGKEISAQEITNFELRKTSPCLPFALETSESALDDLGRSLPINQCKHEYVPTAADRCGFTAGRDDHLVAASEESKSGNQIDLSPMNFACMDSGCEMEYAQSARQFRNSLAAQNSSPLEIASKRAPDSLGKEEVRQIISSVFSRELSIDETPQIDYPADTYVPYVDPREVASSAPETENSLELAAQPNVAQPNVAQYVAQYVALVEFWGESLLSHAALQNPAEYVALEVQNWECEFCGSPWLHLAYEFSDSVNAAKARIAARKLAEEKLAKLRKSREADFASVRAKAMIVCGFAKLARSAGQALIEVSDSLEKISTKKVESIAPESY